MKSRNYFLFISVIAVFLICFTVINIKYDRLSRYPYDDAEARKLIDLYMSDDDIEYLIDYAINPEYFIRYIECPDFNIYHVESYDKAYYIYWYADTNDIVSLVEKIYTKEKAENIDYELSLLKNYHINEINYYLDNSEMFAELELASNPSDFNPEIESEKTVANYVPDDMITDNDIVLKDKAYKALMDSFEEINETFKCMNNGGIKVLNSYLSFEELTLRNANPGRNIHQLGNSVDLDIKNSIFFNNADYVEMKDIFEGHGFTFTECEFSDLHLTYTGVVK